MDGVVLLSELHPRAWKTFNPLKQSMEWFGLLTQDDLADLQQQERLSYAHVIDLVERRCRERGDILVLRDWAHLDFTGVPFLAAPPYRPLLHAALVSTFDVIRISTTRDPVTQWQSLTRLALMREPIQSGAFGIDQFLVGYRKYAELCAEIGFVRYEDFLRTPELVMKRLCEQLQIKFDPGFIEKWPNYKTITGDISNPLGSNKIESPPGRPVTPELTRKFLANADYRRACELLGYDTLEI